MTNTKATHMIATTAVLAISSLLLSNCGGDSHDDRLQLQLTGSSTLAPLMVEIAKRYEAAHKNVRIVVQTGGSSRGISDVASGLADLGMSSRPLKDSEREGSTTHIIAQDGVGFLVNAKNPVEELTDEQIVDIFTGKVRNWNEVGGLDAPINCVNRIEGRSELELFQEFFAVKPEDFKVELVSGENQHGIETVAGDENAIIYMSVGASEFEAANGTPIRLLPFHRVAASSKTVEGGEYPLSRPLILVTKSEPSEAVKDFLNYALSHEVHDLVTHQFYVPAKAN